MSGEDFRVPGAHCVNCGKAIDGAMALRGGRGPQPGDLSICAFCSHLAAYGDDMRLRNLNDEEVREAAGDPDLIRAMKALGAWKAGHGV